MNSYKNRLLASIKWFAIFMMVPNLFITLLWLPDVLYNKKYAILNITPYAFSLLLLILLYRAATKKKYYVRVIGYLWPLVICIGLFSSIYIIKGIVIYNQYQAYYRPDKIFLYQPLAVSVLIIIYGALIGFAVKLRNSDERISG